MGRAMRAGVRVGLFVCFSLCRERPSCEGAIHSVAVEGSETKIWVFSCVSRAPCGVMARRAWPREIPLLSGRS